ncbi:MAG TPA: hypothetical protein VMM37_08785 [Bacteroidota bacterium]|nr:hypothetical protein [Bacteroidota bacterium]
MRQRNCWEFKNCGREPGGAKVAEFGVCPSATEVKLNGVNRGKNGGRACWALTGTLCGGKVQGTFASKLNNCLHCEFYGMVGTEEGSSHRGSREILALLS